MLHFLIFKFNSFLNSIDTSRDIGTRNPWCEAFRENKIELSQSDEWTAFLWFRYVRHFGDVSSPFFGDRTIERIKPVQNNSKSLDILVTHLLDYSGHSSNNMNNIDNDIQSNDDISEYIIPLSRIIECMVQWVQWERSVKSHYEWKSYLS